MTRRDRYHRFDPVTIRAAARVVSLGRAGHLAGWEVDYYLRELAAMEPGAGARAFRRLRRMARRWSVLGNTGVTQASKSRRRYTPVPQLRPIPAS
jgi:hypothetical protein